MEQERRIKLPIAGRIQHGEQQIINGKKKVLEFGYFISKVKNSNLNFLVNRFNEKYNKLQVIPIRIVSENSFFTRRARYNQGGSVCYYNITENKGKQKVSGVWQKNECKDDCPYRIAKEGEQKPACNREGHLYFMLPEICSDRLWNMIITSQESIENLEGYFKWQKALGNSVIGDYLVCLGQKEQKTKDGKKFTNYILDIIKKEEVNSNNTISENKTEQENQNTTQISQQSNISQKQTTVKEKKETNKPVEETKTTEKKTTKKTSNSKEKKQESVKQEEIKVEEKNSEQKNELTNFYILVETKTQKISKDGELRDYTVGNFVDKEDKTIDVVIPHEFADELIKCDTGTMVKLDLQKAGEKTFTKNIQYIEKYLKNVAA